MSSPSGTPINPYPTPQPVPTASNAAPLTPLTPEQEEMQEQRALHEFYPERVAIAVDKLGNTLLGGQSDETISAHAGRAAAAGEKWGIVLTDFLNWFQKNHAVKAEAGDLARAEQTEQTEEASPDLPKGEGQ